MQLIKIILSVTFLLLATLAFMPQVLKTVDDNTQQCKLSMQAGTFIKNIQGGGGLSLSLQCEPDFISIEESRTTRNGRYETFDGVRKYEKDEQEEIVKEMIAREMARCWEIASRGNSKPYAKLSTWEGLWSGSKNICLICSKIHFEKDFGQIANFSSYIEETNVPGKDITYRGYLTPVKIEPPTVEATEEYDPHIILQNFNKPNWLANLKAFFSGKKAWQPFIEALKTYQIEENTKISTNRDYYVINLANIIASEDYYHNYFNVLIPVDEVHKVCDEIVN